MTLQHAQGLSQQTQPGAGQWVYVQAAPQAPSVLWGYVQQPQQGVSEQWVYAPVAAPMPAPQAGHTPSAADFVAPEAVAGYAFDLYQRRDVPTARRGPKNYVRSDERIRELICERLIRELSVDVSEVSVEVSDGRVALSGTVPERHMKHIIEDVVDGCWGVQKVDNDMRVQPPQPPARASVGDAGGGFAGV